MGCTDEELLAKRDELKSRDVAQIAQIRNYGVDVDEQRQIDLTFWAPTEHTAQLFVEVCERNGMPTGVVFGPSPSEANQRWLVRCHINTSVTFVTIKENAVTFLLFADKYDCDYDGWGTAIVEAASPVSSFEQRTKMPD